MMHYSDLFKVPIVSLLLLCLSCDDAVEPNLLQEASIQDSFDNDIKYNDYLSFIYKGVTYSSYYIIENDSVVILNDSVKQIVDKMSSLPELVSYVNNNSDVIHYFDNPSEAELWLNNPILKSVESAQKSASFVITGAILTLFDDVNFKDRSQPFKIEGKGNTVRIDHLKDKYDFNDKTSSLKLNAIGSWTSIGASNIRIVATLYEDEKLKGNSIWFHVVNYDSAGYPLLIVNEINSLKNYPLYPGSSRNWNDKITSFELKYF